ncbi:MAG: hypothetical protein COV60_00835 [Candidatus Magasanikbacteria bacterium CG11_big_fil_rev_8_21_14_0_20_43_7]|uniref:Uncharacterized protein n=1 Tax=Candidatus Magasanikbacteria bacterium CG11_big_fil_rev_8_21_14_0_20_43_7 TaxID=1974654 RepID=A0A2H0N394_9BACT|nr:MAG: hypothetical protein COV60_00835 [Candidatus Magasanikbacteria bacterium CG11_big_fil_rev_8_21_14_0_20_43_7]
MKFDILVQFELKGEHLLETEEGLAVMMSEDETLTEARDRWRGAGGTQFLGSHVSVKYEDIKDLDVSEEAFEAFEALLKVEQMRDVFEGILREVVDRVRVGLHVSTACREEARRNLEEEQKE